MLAELEACSSDTGRSIRRHDACAPRRLQLLEQSACCVELRPVGQSRDIGGGVRDGHELHVAEAAARVGGEAHRVPGVLVAAGGRAAPDPGMAARRGDDRVGDDDGVASVLDVEEAGDLDVVAKRDAQLGRRRTSVR